MNNKLDIRFSDYLQNTYKYGMHSTSLTFQTKKQITFKDNYSYWPTVSTIEIKCKNWPITASWDPTLFQNEELNGSLFTSWYPGGWFDAIYSGGNLFLSFLKDQGEVLFEKNYHDGFIGEYGNRCAYLNDRGDSISLYWIALANSSIVGIDEIANNQLKIFPNPANDWLYINSNLNSRFDKCIIYSISGKIEYCSKAVFPLNISNLKNGIYFIELSSKKGVKHFSRFIKQ
jgi:hypothetical protein